MLHGRMLDYLDEVARLGSIRKAAERLHVSPTAVNKQILQIEQQLGVELFQRLPRGMRLTAAGEIMIEHVRQTLRGYRVTTARLDDIRSTRGGDASIATMQGLASGLVARTVATFCDAYPRTRVDCQTLFIPAIVKAVLDGDADIGLGYNLPRDPKLSIVGSYEAPLGAVVPVDHPLAGETSIRPADCLDHALVAADESMVMHRTISDIFTRAGASFVPRFRSNSVEFMKSLVLDGKAIAFLSRFDVAGEVAAGQVRHIAFHNAAPASNTLMLVCRRKGTLEPTTGLLVERLKQELEC